MQIAPSINGYDIGARAAVQQPDAQARPGNSTAPSMALQTPRAPQAPFASNPSQPFVPNYPQATLLVGDRLQPTQTLLARQGACQSSSSNRLDKNDYSQKMDRLKDLSRMAQGQSRSISLMA
jgi:hypothetical protein